MESAGIIEKLASGEAVTVLATCVFVLLLAVRSLYSRVNEVTDKRIDDQRMDVDRRERMQHETNLALAAITKPLEELMREMRARK